jgi:hypothetical protein
VRQRAFDLFHRRRRVTAHRGAVGEEVLRQRVAVHPRDVARGRPHQDALRPGAEDARQAVRRGITHRRRRKPSVELDGDAQGVAVHVGSDLQHRCPPIAAGEGHERGLGQDHRHDHGPPVELLQPEDEPHLLGIGRRVVVMKDQVHAGRACSACRSATGRMCGPRPLPDASAEAFPACDGRRTTARGQSRAAASCAVPSRRPPRRARRCTESRQARLPRRRRSGPHGGCGAPRRRARETRCTRAPRAMGSALLGWAGARRVQPPTFRNILAYALAGAAQWSARENPSFQSRNLQGRVLHPRARRQYRTSARARVSFRERIAALVAVTAAVVFDMIEPKHC